MDTEAVLAAASRAVERARSGGGPSYLECATYRFEGHHTMERRMRLTYRSPEEIAAWRERDPLARAAALLSDAEREQIDQDVEHTLAAALAFAMASPQPDPQTATDYLYASGLRPRSGAGV
jgi:pyruvate dehydrogenase E1 component alpha subunit